MNERDLVVQAKGGDDDAMSLLYHQCADVVFTIVRRICGDQHLAEDLSQDVWVRAFEKIGQFRGDSPFCAWVSRLARNLVIDHFRRAKRFVATDDDLELMPLADPPVDIVVDRIVLENCLDELPDGYRTVLVLYVMQGLKHDEIARQLNVTSATSRTQLFKARARMLQCLGSEVGSRQR